MQKVQLTIQEIESKTAEIARLESAGARASKDKLEASRRGAFEKDLARISNAGALADAIPLRTKVLCGELVTLEGRLAAELQQDIPTWNSFVAARAEAKFSEVLAAVLPFWGGLEKEKLTRREFEGLHIPAVAEIKNAFIEVGGIGRLNSDALLALAKRVVDHCDRWWTSFGLELPVNLPAVARRAAAAKRVPASARMQVRTLRELLLGDFKVISGKVKDVTSPPWITGQKVMPGAVLEISPVQYQALSASVEVLTPDSAAGDK